MRLVKVNAPQGQGAVIAQMALDLGILNATVYEVQVYSKERGKYFQDVIEVKTSSPEAKEFIEKLMEAPFFNPDDYAISVRYPRSIVSSEKTRRVTMPFVVPPIDIYEELWEFSHITYSFVGRAFAAAMLLSYGMIHYKLLIMISGLLFFPYIQEVLAVAFGICTREWKLTLQGILALAAATSVIILAAALCALLTHPPLQYQEFSPILTGFLIAIVIGSAAGLASADNTGKRELIGLTISAQTAIFAAWFGISLVYGFPEMGKTMEHIASFFVNIITITVTASITYYLMNVRGRGIRNYADALKK